MPFTQLAEVNEVASIGEEECVWLQKVPVLDQFISILITVLNEFGSANLFGKELHHGFAERLTPSPKHYQLPSPFDRVP